MALRVEGGRRYGAMNAAARCVVYRKWHWGGLEW